MIRLLGVMTILVAATVLWISGRDWPVSALVLGLAVPHWLLCCPDQGRLALRANGVWRLPGSDDDWRLVGRRVSPWLVALRFRRAGCRGRSRVVLVFKDDVGRGAHRRLRRLLMEPGSDPVWRHQDG